MNILGICHFSLYQNLTNSFVHHQMKAFVELGHRVRMIIPIGYGKKNPDGKRFDNNVVRRMVDGVELVYVRYLTLSRYGEFGFNSGSAILSMLCKNRQLMKDFRADIIHAHTLGFDSQIGVWWAKRIKCPIIVTTHGSDTSVPYEKGKREYLNRCCKNVDCIVAVSSALAEKLRSCGTQTPIISILNGYDLANLPPECDKQELSFLQVGNLIQSKRVNITIKAFAEIKTQYPEAKLYIIGEGPERENLKQLCKELDVLESVSFMGRVPNPQVLKKMSETLFFIMPSVREGFGIVYLEAMACGCITIGTMGEGIADLIISGQNGILVPPDDPSAIVKAVTECLVNGQKADTLAMNGKKDAKLLSWNANAQKYLRLFKETIDDSKYHD